MKIFFSFSGVNLHILLQVNGLCKTNIFSPEYTNKLKLPYYFTK